MGAPVIPLVRQIDIDTVDIDTAAHGDRLIIFAQGWQLNVNASCAMGLLRSITDAMDMHDFQQDNSRWVQP